MRALPDRPALQAQAPQPVVVAADPAPATIYAETPQQIETVAWTLSQLADAGFELPPVTIHMHSDRAGCSSDPERLFNGYWAIPIAVIIENLGDAPVATSFLVHFEWFNPERREFEFILADRSPDLRGGLTITRGIEPFGAHRERVHHRIRHRKVRNIPTRHDQNEG